MNSLAEGEGYASEAVPRVSAVRRLRRLWRLKLCSWGVSRGESSRVSGRAWWTTGMFGTGG